MNFNKTKYILCTQQKFEQLIKGNEMAQTIMYLYQTTLNLCFDVSISNYMCCYPLL